MQNKQTKIKLFIYFIVTLSLLVNAIFLSHEKIYESGNYAVYNKKIIGHYENINQKASLEDKQRAICSNIKSPFGDLTVYYSLVLLSILMTIISIIVILLFFLLKKYKIIKSSNKHIFFATGIELLSLAIFA